MFERQNGKRYHKDMFTKPVSPHRSSTSRKTSLQPSRACYVPLRSKGHSETMILCILMWTCIYSFVSESKSVQIEKVSLKAFSFMKILIRNVIDPRTGRYRRSLSLDP